MVSKGSTGNSTHAVAALAGRQHGVVSRRQLRSLGLSDRAITARASAGLLHPLFRGTFAVGHRAVGRRGRMLAASLACGDGTVISHGSAAELLGLWEKKVAAVELIAPCRAGRKIQGIRRHYVVPPVGEEIEMREGIPCTSPSRTLVDMAGRLGRRSLQGLVEQAAVLGVLDPRAVDRVLARGRRRGAPQLRMLLDAWRNDAGTPRLRSRLEARLLTALAEAELPRPLCNKVLRIEGHRLEVDFIWEDQRLVVETDGEGIHGTRVAFQRDRWRDQLLTATGYRVARVTWRQVEDEPTATVRRIRQMLAS